MKPVGPGITCPGCGGSEHEVRDSRASADMIRRRRLCQSCDGRFTTYEIVSEQDHDMAQLHAARRLYGELHDIPKRPRRLIEALIRTWAKSSALDDVETDKIIEAART